MRDCHVPTERNRPRYNLVVDEDVKKSNKQTNKLNENGQLLATRLYEVVQVLL